MLLPEDMGYSMKITVQSRALAIEDAEDFVTTQDVTFIIATW